MAQKRLKGVLQINVIDAYQLQDNEDDLLAEIQDPYCVIQILNEKHRTKTKTDALNPHWNEQFDFMEYFYDSSAGRKYGQIIVNDEDFAFDDFIGQQQFELPSEYSNKWISHVLELKNKQGRPQGVVTIQIKFVPVQQYAMQPNGNTEARQKADDKYDKSVEAKLNRSSGCECSIL